MATVTNNYKEGEEVAKYNRKLRTVEMWYMLELTPDPATVGWKVTTEGLEVEKRRGLVYTCTNADAILKWDLPRKKKKNEVEDDLWNA